MGRHLAQLLATDGIKVTVTSRNRSGGSGLVRFLRGNAQDVQFLSGVLEEKWDVVVDFMVYATAAFHARAELFQNATSQYVFISTARVYADSSQCLTESSPRLLDVSQDKAFLATDEYALAKARQEDILKNSGRTNWTIIRPYITYGEERLQLGVLEKEGWLYRAMHGRTIVFSSDILKRVTTLTHGFDVATGIRAIVGKPKALGEAFHITANTSLTWETALSVYSETLERKLGSRPKILLRALHEFCKVHPAKHQIKYDRMFDRRFDNAKIGQFVDTRGFVDPKVGLRQCLEAFLASPRFLQVHWKIEALKDRQTREHTPLPEIIDFKNKAKYLLHRYALAG